MVTFYICRHGQTEFNLQERVSGWIDTPLTEVGLANVQTIADKLEGIEFDAIYSSDLGRAFVTAYIISRRLNFTDEILRTPQLREVSYGDLASEPWGVVEAQHPDLNKKVDFVPPGGESLATMQARVLAFVKELNENGGDQTVLLAAHDGVIKALYANYADADLGVHNSTYGYLNDFVASFTVDENGKVNSFAELTV